MKAKIGTILGCAGFTAAMVAVYLASCTNVFARMLGQETFPISGDPKKFDPIAGLAEVQAKVGAGSVLTELEIWYVRADGTMDLMADYNPQPYAEYTFEVAAKDPPKTLPPIGAGRAEGDVWLETVRVRVSEPGRTRYVRRTSGGVSTSYSYRMEGMDFSRGSPHMGKLPKAINVAPTVLDAWKLAIKAGASKEAVARMEYRLDDVSFEIDKTEFDLRWDGEGKLKTNSLSTEMLKRLGLSDR